MPHTNLMLLALDATCYCNMDVPISVDPVDVEYILLRLCTLISLTKLAVSCEGGFSFTKVLKIFGLIPDYRGVILSQTQVQLCVCN